MKGFDTIKLVSLGATLLGLAGTLLSGWASEKKMQEQIEEEVQKQLESKEITESSN